MRFSRQRQVILNIINSANDTPDVDWIFREAQKVIGCISIATVHRNLKLLSEIGEITPIQAPDGAMRYNVSVTQNTHFICDKCKEVFEMGINDFHFSELDRRGFRITKSRHIYYGRCQKCIAACGQEEKITK